jgi:ElaB/YqjD/DUF883 family membrane-anchored ribosome-binding protein
MEFNRMTDVRRSVKSEEKKVMPLETAERPAAVDQLLDSVPKIKDRLTDKFEDGVRSARRAIKHGRYAAEDLIEEAQHTVRQKPLEAVAVVFAAGVLAGALAGGVVTWFGFRRR